MLEYGLDLTPCLKMGGQIPFGLMPNNLKRGGKSLPLKTKSDFQYNISSFKKYEASE